jgi:phenylacetate-CoA ligase
MPLQNSHPNPALRPGPASARQNTLTNLVGQLSRSQWWSQEEMRDHQFRRLRALLAHADATVPFYRQRFRETGVDPATISPDNWGNLPLLTRSDLQEHDLFSSRLPPGHGRTYPAQTSGSTGQPVKIIGTDLTRFFWRALTIRDNLWHNRDLTARMAAIKYNPQLEVPPGGITGRNWGGLSQGQSLLHSVRTPIAGQLAWLARHNPDYLLTYPSNLTALLEASRESGIFLGRLREVRTISETLSPELRALCQETWGVKITDTYSSQEVGYIALQCPAHGHYHNQSESVLVEVLDDRGAPCHTGEIGRVVLTALYNYATPLIRYEIRDYAEVGPATCPCGRGLPLLKRVVGRQRNMLVLPSGEKCWPITGFPRYREVAPIRQFQFIQHSLEEVEMKLVCDRPLTDSDRARLTGIIQAGLGHPFAIRFTPMALIPQEPNGKFEEFISLVSQPPPGKTVSSCAPQPDPTHGQ